MWLNFSTFVIWHCFLLEPCQNIVYNLVKHLSMLNSMQTYLQSITVRLEEWRLKRRDTEEWMSHRQLPQNLRERVRRFVQYKWLATRGVDEETILRGLPTDLRRDIQCHLCLDLVRRVSSSQQMFMYQTMLFWHEQMFNNLISSMHINYNSFLQFNNL